MNSILSVNYATLLRKFRDRRATTNLSRLGKSQTLSGQSRKVLFVAWPVLRKVRTAWAQFNATKLRSLEQATKITKNLDGIPQIRESLTPEFRRLASADWRALRKMGTASPLFKALPAAAILSAPWIELSQSKIQTASGEFRRRRLRHPDLIATTGGGS